ncbi:MAG TPA: hypothetical protein VES20_21570 [Bryobacteraceae bacterium]|nr:hypothetical protein [Bryobacteraceae bacterium]
MNRAVAGGALLTLAALSFWWFPCHSILQSDTQVYLPVLEHLHDTSVLRADIMAVRGHVQWTIFDEVAIGIRKLTGAGFESILLTLHFLSRLAGAAGVYLLALRLGTGGAGAFALAAIVSLGALVHGPTVLTVEYEPVPRGFALQLALLSLGCAAHRSFRAAAVAGATALAFHPPTAGPAYVLLMACLLWRRDWHAGAVLLSGVGLLTFFWWLQPAGIERPTLLTAISPELEVIQKARSSYNWVSLWWTKWIRHYTVMTAVTAFAVWRLWPQLPRAWRAVLVLMPALGLISPVVSWLLLEQFKMLGAAQLQPARYLLLLTLTGLFASAAAGLLDRRWPVRLALLFFVFAVPMTPDITLLGLQQTAVAFGLALLASMPRTAVVPAVAACIALPLLANVRPVVSLHTSGLDALSTWAKSSTPQDAIFQFADVRRGLQPGVFRARALRAIYADWKAGGQANFLPSFAVEWWKRWHLIKEPRPVAFYRDLGIHYLVFTRSGAPPGVSPVYSNPEWVVLATGF